MPSDYAGFEVKVAIAGVEYPVVSEVVKVYDIEDADPTTGTGAIALSDLATDGAGMVAGGTFAGVAVGRTVRFSVRRASDGISRSYTQVTT